ncbi:MAG: hypothetical protein CXZ00_09310 [Acidobacteria bacterium]|nr:MAG: hypothetical protein CXZ00_09310 [Acidobacteriota bacterium]
MRPPRRKIDWATMSKLPLVSVLFVTYKRIELLRDTLHSFLNNTAYPNLELVVTDDGSGPEIQEQIRKLPFQVFVLSKENRGLGANINAGLRACSGKYVLLLQDDWHCEGPSDYLLNSVSVCENNADVGLINFYGMPHKFDSANALPGSNEPCHKITEQFWDGKQTWNIYTDTPHVMTMKYFQRVGPYRESSFTEDCEMDYEARFAAQKQFSAALFPSYYNRLFRHTGEAHSFRTIRFRYRVEKLLLPYGIFLKSRCRPLYTAGKFILRRSVKLLESSGIVR